MVLNFNFLNGKWKSIGIQKKILLIGLLVLVLFSNSLATLFFTYYTDSVYKEIENNIEKLALETSQLISKILEVNMRPLLALANILQTEDRTIDEYVNLLKWNHLNLYEILAFVDLDGLAYYIDDSTLDLHDRNYIRKALNGESNYSDLIISRVTGEAVILGAVPVYANLNNRVKGAIFARFNLDTIKDLFTSIGYGDTGYSYLIDSKDFFIIHHNEEYTKGILRGVNLFDLARIDTRIDDFTRFYENSKNKSNGFGKYTLEDETMWAGYSGIEGTNWKLFIVGYQKVILDNLRRTRSVLINILFFVNALSFAGMIYVSNSLSKPILELDRAFIQAIDGDMGVRMQVKNSDEVSRVSENFNRMMDKIHTLVYKDPVTTLPNLSVLRDEISFSEMFKDQKPVLILISIDNWFILHETFGNRHVDDLQRKIAECLKDGLIGHNDARLYKSRSDEYVLCIRDNANKEYAIHLARKLLKTLRKPFKIQEKNFLPEVNIGIDFSMNDSQERLFSHVTNAKNRARDLGGNTISVYDEKYYLNVLESRDLVEDLLKAIEVNQFSLVFQPLVDLKTNQTVLVEVLLRWKHKTKGEISPSVFIELAERLKIIDKIDYWVIDNSFKKLKESKSSVHLSINVTVQTFERDDFVDYIIERGAFHKVKLNKIQIELTERDLIKNVDQAIQKLNLLRTAGISIAIDDFGMGYSSLSYIVKLPVDCIKIDRSFIHSMNEDESSRVLIKMIISMCKALGFKVVAEGIENETEVQTLIELDCQLGQGYYFSRPQIQINN